jgi:ParB family chromosome partitioning protein
MDPDEVQLIEDPKHPLYDERVEKPLTEKFIVGIMKFGVKKPVEVRKNGKTPEGRDIVEVVDGRRRLRGAREANKRLVAQGSEPITIQVIIVKGDDADMDARMVLGNENRENDDLIIKARKAKRLIDLHGIEYTSLLFGKEEKEIEGWLDLLNLAPDIQKKIQNGDINENAAYELISLPRAEQLQVVAKMTEDGKVTASGVKGAVEKRQNPKRFAARERLKASRNGLLSVAWNWVSGTAKLDDLKEAASEFAAAKEAAKIRTKKPKDKTKKDKGDKGDRPADAKE